MSMNSRMTGLTAVHVAYDKGKKVWEDKQRIEVGLGYLNSLQRLEDFLNEHFGSVGVSTNTELGDAPPFFQKFRESAIKEIENTEEHVKSWGPQLWPVNARDPGTLDQAALKDGVEYLNQIYLMRQLGNWLPALPYEPEKLFARLTYQLGYVYVMTGHPDLPTGWGLMFRSEERTPNEGFNIFERGFGEFKERAGKHA